MNLMMYGSNKVRIVDVDGQTWIGGNTDYQWPESNENGKESLLVFVTRGPNPDLCNGWVEFWEHDIKTIEIIS